MNAGASLPGAQGRDLTWADYLLELARHHLEPEGPEGVRDTLTGQVYAAGHIPRRDETVAAAMLWASLRRAAAGIEPPRHLPPPLRRLRCITAERIAGHA